MARPHLRLKDGQWNLWRLSDEEFTSLAQHALPIAQNYSLILRLTQRQSANGNRLTLGQAVVVLERRFGQGSSWYDSFRGSFCFPLLLTFERERRISYLLRLHDYRGTLYFPLYRVVKGDPSSVERARFHAPCSSEFSQAEMNDFTSCLYDYVLGVSDTLDDSLVAPFYRAVESDAILYGYDNGRFFEQSCDNFDEFCAGRAQYEQRLGPGRSRSSSDRVEKLIDRLVEL
jgi:hypothetical protein